LEPSSCPRHCHRRRRRVTSFWPVLADAQRSIVGLLVCVSFNTLAVFPTSRLEVLTGTALDSEFVAQGSISSPDSSGLEVVTGTADPEPECRAQILFSSPDAVLNMVHPHPGPIEPIVDVEPIGAPNIGPSGFGL
jgi:hypothetical protein